MPSVAACVARLRRSWLSFSACSVRFSSVMSPVEPIMRTTRPRAPRIAMPCWRAQRQVPSRAR